MKEGWRVRPFFVCYKRNVVEQRLKDTMFAELKISYVLQARRHFANTAETPERESDPTGVQPLG